MDIGPQSDLPYNEEFVSTEAYIESLLHFAEANDLFKTLCGGVHILDFFTNNPDLYSQILPESWRTFIRAHTVMNFLDLLLREPLNQDPSIENKWREGPCPPDSLIAYIKDVRRHLLTRVPASSQCSRNRAMKPVQKMAWRVAVGMNVKKVHEVGLFASYIDQLTTSISTATQRDITHLVDFGSGQNYLGRALASLPYSKNVVAIETKGHNQDRARKLDQMAKLSARERFTHQKKAAPKTEVDKPVDSQVSSEADNASSAPPKRFLKLDPAADGVGEVQYVDQHIVDGDLTRVVEQIAGPASCDIVKSSDNPSTRIGFSPAEQNLMVISLHSCGNLVHHGLRSLVHNREVAAVAMVGCCYNLITERLSPATYKLPELRPSAHPRVEAETMAGDPHGFPMSERLGRIAGDGVRLNITARMMAVQAPSNWGEKDSDAFFTRHFFRALLQRIFLDKAVVGPPTRECVGGSPLGHTSGTPIIIGSLRKSCYANFVAYVRGALAKLVQDPDRGDIFREKMGTITDGEIEQYEKSYGHRKKELSAIWSLMAFSAGVVESLIVVDRYSWLKEQPELKRAWVEPVFDYAMSPRNLVVVGIKGRDGSGV